ncbi:hypothetical protein GCM10009718_27770 [Isoptericola halotolerans]|uniref:Phosphopantetheinyl transferase n=1 Tax=Isoptericola halotolerans TaxID=300560 RepID=A0ABX2A3H6_9MICO|nr:hypothetical protein [Isoptericola halotolerans]NOV97373.1 phosphopantetheinyl transferase [Isoptericola halotolerans]
MNVELWVGPVLPVARCVPSLSPEDAAAVRRAASSAVADLVATSRTMQRSVLARTLGVSVEDVRIDRRCARCGHIGHGRPVAVDGPAYSVTRSGRIVAMAVVPCGAVGLDAEEERAGSRAWVRGEAALKARGLGIDRLWAPEPQWIFDGLHLVDLRAGRRIGALATDRPVASVCWRRWRPGPP